MKQILTVQATQLTPGSAAFMLAGLALSLGFSIIVIRFFLRRDADYAGAKPFPLDALTVFSLLFYTCVYGWTHLNYVVSFSQFLLVFSYLSMLFITAYIDLRTKAIYDIILLLYAPVLLFFVFFEDAYTIRDSLLSMLIGGGFYAIIYLAARLIYKREAFGQGDIFLMALAAVFMKPMMTVIACFLSFYIAALFLLISYPFRRKMDSMAEIPFGPYICLSSWVFFLYGDRVMDWIYGFLV